MLFLAVETRRNQPLGTLIRCASAFGVTALVVIGSKHFSTHGSHGSHRRMNVLHFYYWSDCVEHMRKMYPDIVFGAITPTSDSLGSKNVPAYATDEIVYRSNCVCLVAQSDVRMELTTEQINIVNFSVYVRLPHKVLEPHLHWMTKLSLVFQTFGRQKRFGLTDYTGQKFSVTELQEGSTASIQTFPSTRIVDNPVASGDNNEGNSIDDDEDCGMGDLFST
jgi:hypothetical protein